MVVVTRLNTPQSVHLRVFVFPHAGGSGAEYKPLAGALGEHVEVYAVELPGRGRQFNVSPYTRWPDMLAAVQAALYPHLDDTPLAFLGHSFGALVAFETASELQRQGLRAPDTLIVSAHAAPNDPNTSVWTENVGSLSDDELVSLAERYGLVSAAELDNPALRQLTLPALRSDLALDAGYRAQSVTQLAGRVLYVGALDDAFVGGAAPYRWTRCVDLARGSYRARTVAGGGHFYLLDVTSNAVEILRAELEAVLATRAASRRTSPITSSVAERIARGTFDSQFFACAAECHDRVAIREGSDSHTYGALARRAERLAVYLAKRGCAVGFRIGVLLPPGAHFVCAMVAIARCRAVTALLETNWSAPMLAGFLSNHAIERVVTTRQLWARHAQRLEGIAEAIFSDEIPLMATDADTPVTEAHPHPLSDMALLSLTSGTTGEPKAVITTHGGMLHCLATRYELYPDVDGDVDGLHVFFAWECMRPLLVGRTACVIPADVLLDPPRFLAHVAEAGITRLTLTPSLLDNVLDYLDAHASEREKLRCLRQVFLMGELVAERLVRKCAACLPAGLEIVNAYSTWESLDVSYARYVVGDDVSASVYAGVMSAGTPMPGVEVCVIDDDEQVVPEGVEGTLAVKSCYMSSGYLGSPELCARAYRADTIRAPDGSVVPGRFYMTGDRAVMRPGAELFLLGRTGTTVKVRGHKVSLETLELVLSRTEGVLSAASRYVEARQGEPGRLLAYITVSGAAESSMVVERAWRELRENLPAHYLPQQLLVLDALPVRAGTSRKLDRQALPIPAEPASPVNRGEPQDAGYVAALKQTWCEVLRLEAADEDANFFEVGGTSLLAAKLTTEAAARFGITLNVLDIYESPTLRELLARHERPLAAHPSDVAAGASHHGQEIAVIGVAGRFPGARTVAQFWEHLTVAHDSLHRFSAAELESFGFSSELVRRPSWVAAAQHIDGAGEFDSRFWGIAPQEAELMDPQHRVFMEVVWHALEDAGYNPAQLPRRSTTGVFAACGIDGYLFTHLDGGGLRTPEDPGRVFLTEIGNEKDYIATRVAYALDLGGPALTVTSACSSGLAAVAQAARALEAGDCDVAIAGASSITFPNIGYSYAEGLVASRDGLVRPFDRHASGTLFGDGIGAVILKRLSDAERDGDRILARVSGVGMSNDGAGKAGFSAPSADAQRRCIETALRRAGVSSNEVSYVECHATATTIGDAIELRGLLHAFRTTAQAPLTPRSCAIGSVKGNIGHANCAAGITGFIKTVLQLERATLVPTANFRELNPKLYDFVDTERSPFYVQTCCAPWSLAGRRERIAGVSSFGIGGTNVHVVLKEHRRESSVATLSPRPEEILTFSARSAQALMRNVQRYRDQLDEKSGAGVAHVAYTLHRSRTGLPYRKALLVRADTDLRSQVVRELVSDSSLSERAPRVRSGLIFCFPGQGSHYQGMGRELLRWPGLLPGFREAFKAVTELFRSQHAIDVGAALERGDTLRDPVTIQPAIFALEYAIGAALLGLGLRPLAMAGHGLGEYAAVCLSNVLELEAACRLVAVRARAAARHADASSLLAIRLEPERVEEVLAGLDDVWLAAINGVKDVTVGGTRAAIEALSLRLSRRKIAARRLLVSHAFHTPLLREVGEELASAATGVEVQAPSIPVVSNWLGRWATANTFGLDYWLRHITEPVQWLATMQALQRWAPDAVVEVGPGNVLTGLFKRHGAAQVSRVSTVHFAQTLNPAQHTGSPHRISLTLAKLWERGFPVDWHTYHRHEHAGLRLISLPGYAFEATVHQANPRASIHGHLTSTPEAVSMASEPRQVVSQHAKAPVTPKLLVMNEAEQPRLTLICLSHAGGSALSFESWVEAAPSWLELRAYDLPGRNGRSDEHLLRDDADDARELQWLAAEIDHLARSRRVALLGTSFGALWAVELATSYLPDLVRSGQLCAIYVIGRAPIGAREPAPVEWRAAVSLDEKSEAVQWLYEQRLRSDLEADRRAEARLRARATTERPRLPRLEVFCARNDRTFDWRIADRWHETFPSEHFAIRVHEGDHDFMRKRAALLCREVAAALAEIAHDEPASSEPHVETYEVNYAQPAVSVRSAAAISCIELQACLHLPSTQLPRQGSEVTFAVWADAASWSPAQPPQAAAVAEHALLVFKSLEHIPGPFRVTLCTTDSQFFSQAAALARTFMLEYPRARILVALFEQRVDELPEIVHQCIAAGEVALIVRGAGKEAHDARVPRLRRSPSAASLTFPEDAVVLVTGGSGGLGGLLRRWLVEEKHLERGRVISLSRSSPAHDVDGICADISDSKQLAASSELARLERVDFIFHLAGVLEDAAFFRQTPERFGRVVAPKAGLLGLLDLAEERAWPLRAVVAFSSTTSLLGTMGQANYAVANAVLDWLADFGMRWRSLPNTKLLTVHWGPWAERGMAREGTQAAAESRRNFDYPMPTDAALTALDGAMAELMRSEEQSRRVAICKVDWQRSPWRETAIIRDLEGLRREPVEHEPRVAASDARDLQGLLAPHVSRWESDVPMSDLGVDSMDLVQMQNQINQALGTSIPLSVFTVPRMTLGQLMRDLEHAIASEAVGAP